MLPGGLFPFGDFLKLDISSLQANGEEPLLEGSSPLVAFMRSLLFRGRDHGEGNTVLIFF